LEANRSCCEAAAKRVIYLHTNFRVPSSSFTLWSSELCVRWVQTFRGTYCLHRVLCFM